MFNKVNRIDELQKLFNVVKEIKKLHNEFPNSPGKYSEVVYSLVTRFRALELEVALNQKEELRKSVCSKKTIEIIISEDHNRMIFMVLRSSSVSGLVHYSNLHDNVTVSSARRILKLYDKKITGYDNKFVNTIEDWIMFKCQN